MRPQIRSIPLDKAECPQFSWAVRNNAATDCIGLRANLINPLPPRDERNHNCLQNGAILGTQSCSCVDPTLKPTLFPHPVTCVCSDDPDPPRDDKYRYRKVRMKDETIGEIMETLLRENLPCVCSPIQYKGIKPIKKIIRSTFAPKHLNIPNENVCLKCLLQNPCLLKELLQNSNVNLTPCNFCPSCKAPTENGNSHREKHNEIECICENSKYAPKQLTYDDENACIECLIKDPSLLNKFMNNSDYQGQTAGCRYPGECMGVLNDSMYEVNSFNIPRKSEGFLKKCKWRSDVEFCDCKDASVLCPGTGLGTGGGRGPGTGEETGAGTGPGTGAETGARTGDKSKNSVSKGKNHSKRAKHKNKRAPFTEAMFASTTGKSMLGSTTTNSKKKNPPPIGRWKKPDICERVEIFETNPYEIEKKLGREISSVQVYEHYRNLNLVKSCSTSKLSTDNNVADKHNSFFRHNTTPTSLMKKSKLSTNENMPWNFNNQKNTEDPMKYWTSNKYSLNKKNSNTRLSRKLMPRSPINFNNVNFDRTRGGDDKKMPKYFEYSPNLRSPKELKKVDNSEDLAKKHNQRDNKKLGQMRVKSWHQTLEQNNRKIVETRRKNEDSNVTRNKAKFSEDEDFNEEHVKKDEKQCFEFKELSNRRESMFEDEIEERLSNQRECLKCALKEVQDKFLNSNDHINEVYKNDNSNLMSRKSVILKKTPSFRSGSGVSEEDEDEKGQETEEESQGKPLQENISRNFEEPNFKISEEISEYNFDLSKERSQSAIENKNEKIDLNFLRPKSADRCFYDNSMEKPFFNVIKQRIHSREQSMKHLEKFRKQHYFETHSTKPYLQDIPEHTCVHRFTVDERLCPQPLHKDDFRTSCCIHCDKPMEIEKTIYLDQRESKINIAEEQQKVQKQISKFALRPKPINIGCKNSVMEIKLKPEQNGLLKCGADNIKIKREYYTDSLALRHQKR